MNKKVQDAPLPGVDAGKEVLASSGGALAVVDFGEDAGAGMEGAKAEEFIIPFLSLLQGLSPEVKPVRAGGIEGAAIGMIYNKGTGELYDTEKHGPLKFVPVFRDHNYPEFTPRDAGGGFHGIRKDDDPFVLANKDKYRFAKIPTGNGTELVETYYLYGFLIDWEDNWSRVVIAFSSTSIKKYNRFMTRQDSIAYPGEGGKKIKPPIWAHKWRLGVTFEKNDKGEFCNWSISLDSDENKPLDALIKRTDDLYIQSKASYEDLVAGRAKAAEPPAGDGAGADNTGGAGDPDDEVPF